MSSSQKIIVAACIASVISVIALFPIDLWKGRQQIFPMLDYDHHRRLRKLKRKNQINSRTPPEPLACFIEEFGWGALYKGLLGELIVTLPLTIFQVWVYNIYDPKLSVDSMSFLSQILCGLLIGTLSGIVSTPSENRKVRFQCGGDTIPSESSYNPSNSPIISALVVRLRRWFSGLSITIAKEIVYWMSFIVTFFIIWNLQQHTQNRGENNISTHWMTSSIAGIVGAIIGGILSNPLDVLKARVQTVMATRRKIFDVGTASSESWDDPLAICECGASVIGNRNEDNNSNENIESKATSQNTGNVSSVSNNGQLSPGGNNVVMDSDDDKKEAKASQYYWKRFGKNWWMIHGILPRVLYMSLRYFVTRLWYCLILGKGTVS